GALGGCAGATRLRCARAHRCALTRTLRCSTRVARVNTIDAKVAECVRSNLTNGEAVRDLGNIGDTTDVAARDRVEPGDVADADRVGFVHPHEEPNAIPDVNVLQATGQVLSCLVTHDCVKNTVVE